LSQCPIIGNVTLHVTLHEKQKCIHIIIATTVIAWLLTLKQSFGHFSKDQVYLYNTFGIDVQKTPLDQKLFTEATQNLGFGRDHHFGECQMHKTPNGVAGGRGLG
jgi:hypothetical protein